MYHQMGQEIEATKGTFCICNANNFNTQDIEDLTRCSNRDCPISWFHLRCASLPDHPPRYVGWLCPKCRRLLRPRCAINGLIDLHDHISGIRTQIWLEEDGARVANGAHEERVKMSTGNEENLERKGAPQTPLVQYKANDEETEIIEDDAGEETEVVGEDEGEKTEFDEESDWNDDNDDNDEGPEGQEGGENKEWIISERGAVIAGPQYVVGQQRATAMRPVQGASPTGPVRNITSMGSGQGATKSYVQGIEPMGPEEDEGYYDEEYDSGVDTRD